LQGVLCGSGRSCIMSTLLGLLCRLTFLLFSCSAGDGGSVISGLRGVGHLVYLAAFVPTAGESAAGLGGPVTLPLSADPSGLSDLSVDTQFQ
jgi:hypothetical protein